MTKALEGSIEFRFDREKKIINNKRTKIRKTKRKPQGKSVSFECKTRLN